MTKLDVKLIQSEIHRLATEDDEAADSLLRGLMQNVLSSIAEDPSNAQELAVETLKVFLSRYAHLR